MMKSREYAGYVLAEKLKSGKSSESIVVGIPKCGVPDAWSVAKQLNLPRAFMPGASIRHPGRSGYTIGSISTGEINLHDCNDLPGDYLYHCTRILQSRLKVDYMQYNACEAPLIVENKYVIVVDDGLKTADAVPDCLKNIQKQKPSQIAVAMITSSAQAVQKLSSEVDEQVCLFIQSSENDVDQFRQQSPRVSSEQVMQLLEDTPQPTN